jgi:argininosuccinate lyase
MEKREHHWPSKCSQKHPISFGVAGSQVSRIRYRSVQLSNDTAKDATDPIMVAYNESIYFDKAFFAQDIACSIAFARANIATGILSKHEFAEIERGLNQVLEEWRSNKFVIKPGIDEDIHTANERRLGEIIGKGIAGKLHT